ncbi:sigma-70 family RNA polymerase sigma factor [Seonamhaeicola aphaedonensis]|uniref:RNA polymerase primary sigma factor n=1 Tax=Seonamhaeicola aphaedonensis TaxID=1461338 RepID=A0A3D9HLQ4_9FLAO|nr:RNA polymerase sigma factor RpoD/SigA [Seonamhaeicola aphaedonensis]RED50419.1 RNA polymerase primary sigma factor [Seonamhaeicola aphaedonensis]
MRQLKITKQITNRSSKSLDKYLQDISKLELITADEEVELAQRIKKGDQRALDKLVTANLRFVVSVAKQYQNQGLSLPDLINEGNAGLVKAAKRFDETRGFKFISYAVWWIRQSILQSIAKQARVIRLPLNKIGSINKIRKAYSYLEQTHEREPSAQEIAKNLNLSVNNVKQSMKVSVGHLSMDAPFQEGEHSNLYDIVKSEETPLPDAALMESSLNIEMNRVLETLSKKEAHVIKHFYGISEKHPKSLEEIGDNIGLSRERVRQIKEKGIRRLRHSSKNKVLKKYLG